MVVPRSSGLFVSHSPLAKGRSAPRPNGRNVRGATMGRDREDELDLAYVGGEADAATHRAEDGVTDEEAQAVTR